MNSDGENFTSPAITLNLLDENLLQVDGDGGAGGGGCIGDGSGDDDSDSEGKEKKKIVI